jgi:general secretion pathway protein J
MRGIRGPGFTIQGSGGFTLLELVVSFTIIGLLAVIIASALRVSLGAVERADRMVDALQRMRTSINIINSQVQSQVPLTYEEDGERRYYFEGNGESLQMATAYSIWNGQSICVVRYEVVSDEGDKKALKAYERIIRPSEGAEDVMETELLSGADEIAFEYFYKGPTDEHGEWVDEWPEEGTLPDRLRLSISYNGSRFSMVIPVRVTGRVMDLSAQRASGEETL